MIRVGLAFALPTATFLLLLVRMERGRIPWPAYLPIAVALSLGASSLVWWTWFLLPLTATARLWIDLSFWIVALAAIWRLYPSAAAEAPPARRSPCSMWLAFPLLLAAAAVAAAIFVSATAVLPHGTWDAWAIWNLRARFLFRGFPDLWRDGFSPLLAWSHPDYPLLLPLTVARGWSYVGHETTVIPIMVSAVFATAAAATAAVSLARSRTAAYGLLTAAAILASPAFVSQAPAQIADIPLSFFILAACVMLFHAAEAPVNKTWWLLAGFAAGLAAWTKNEGVLFLVVFFAACGWWTIRTQGTGGFRSLGLVVCGASPALLALGVLKSAIAPPDLLIAGQSAQHIAGNLADTARLRVAFTAVATHLWFGGAARVGVLPIIVFYLLISGVRRPLGVPLVAAVAMCVMLAGYIVVYMLTPYDFGWHVTTSVERVVLHVFPTLVWSMFMAEGPASPATESGAGSATLGGPWSGVTGPG